MNPAQDFLIKKTEDILVERLSRPFFPIPELAESFEEVGEVEPIDEKPFDAKGNALFYPLDEKLNDNPKILEGTTVWGIDGGIVSWRTPIGWVFIGRAVAVRMVFRGYRSFERVIDFPVLPLVVGVPAKWPKEEEAEKILDAAKSRLASYLHEMIQYIPQVISAKKDVRYISSTDLDFEKLGAYFDVDVATARHMRRVMDVARNAAEALAMTTVFDIARNGDIVLRDGRLWGSVGFITALDELTAGEFSLEIANAIKRGIIIAGVIKRPISSYCVSYLAKHLERARRCPSDAIYYFREMPVGKRSSLWKFSADFAKQQDERVRWFYENTGQFYLRIRRGASPIRIDFPTYNNVYRNWIGELTTKTFALGRGSGTPSAYPHAIVYSDNYAKVRRNERDRLIKRILTGMERSEKPEVRSLAQELKLFTEPYYYG